MVMWIQSNGETLPYNIPMAVHERTFENFCDFKGARDRLMTDENTKFTAVDLISVLSHMVDGDLSKLPVNDGRDIGDLIDSDYTIKLEDEVTLWTLYAHVINVIKLYVPDHVPEVFKMNFAGNNYKVTQRRVQSMLLNQPITTGEVIETLEFQRIAAHNMDQMPKESGNLDFNLGLSEFAILVRKDGEDLPHEKTRLNRFIDERKILFRHLPLNYVLDLRFFFIYALINSETNKGSSSFGKVHHVLRKQPKTKWIKRGK